MVDQMILSDLKIMMEKPIQRGTRIAVELIIEAQKRERIFMIS